MSKLLDDTNFFFGYFLSNSIRHDFVDFGLNQYGVVNFLANMKTVDYDESVFADKLNRILQRLQVTIFFIEFTEEVASVLENALTKGRYDVGIQGGLLADLLTNLRELGAL